MRNKSDPDHLPPLCVTYATVTGGRVEQISHRRTKKKISLSRPLLDQHPLLSSSFISGISRDNKASGGAKSRFFSWAILLNSLFPTNFTRPRTVTRLHVYKEKRPSLSVLPLCISRPPLSDFRLFIFGPLKSGNFM